MGKFGLPRSFSSSGFLFLRRSHREEIIRCHEEERIWAEGLAALMSSNIEHGNIAFSLFQDSPKK